MDYLVEHHVRPLYESTVALFEHLVRDGVVPDIPPAHLYYILTGAGPTMFVLAPECRRLTGLDPESDEVIEAHADAVCTLLFGRALIDRAALGKLDVHAHYLPEPYRQALERAGHSQPDGMPADPGLVGRGARGADGPARDRHVAPVGLDPGRPPRRRRRRASTWPAR